MIQATLSAFLVVAAGSLALDFGRVIVAKAQLQDNADVIVRYAAMGLANRLGGVSAARSNAAAASAVLTVDGTAMNFRAQEQTELGIWDWSSRTFVTSNDPSQINAVRVRATHTVGSRLPLVLAGLIGFPTFDIRATSVAVAAGTGYLGDGSGSHDYYVSANSNPWLAGVPEGTVANPTGPGRPDYAGKPKKDDGKKKSLDPADIMNDKADPIYKQTPVEAGTIRITPGEALTFDGINGGANNFASNQRFNADGNLGWIVSNHEGAELGKSDLVAPINSLVAVFLDDHDPTGRPTPARLDFSTPASRDFSVLRPQLRQMFFIGDGRRANGEPQRFIVPPGATRLFIGTMDCWEWNNNRGGFAVTAHTPPIISVVR